MDRPDIAVVGGAVAGLAAAERLRDFADVTLFERQPYTDKRVNCGEAVNDADLVPLAKTPQNGFVNDIDGFQLRIYESTDRPPGSDPITSVELECEPGYIVERDVMERRWAERLAESRVRVEDDTAVGPDRFRELTREFDHVVDATGQPSLSMRTFGDPEAYTGDTVALNATVEGDFSASLRRPRVFFEGYLGYAWSFPKSATHANIGIGWASDHRPDDYMAALRGACERNGLPVPDRSQVRAYTIPRGPSLDPRRAAISEHGVFLVGDAAGLANRYQGEGICQAIRSSYLLSDLLERGQADRYPERLYESMRAEYRLASLMRGVWEEHEDPYLLAAVADRLEGLTIVDITRRPSRVLGRVATSPRTALNLLADRGMLERLWRAYTDRWEYETRATGPGEDDAGGRRGGEVAADD